jgi:hypothetical protein
LGGGLFKKMVVAGSVAVLVDQVYAAPGHSRGRPYGSPSSPTPCRSSMTSWATRTWRSGSLVLWGGLHGSCLAIERMLRGEGKAASASWTAIRAWLKAAWIFLLVSVTCVFLRSPSLETTVIVWRQLLLVDPGGLTWWFAPALFAVPPMMLGEFLAPMGVAIPYRTEAEPASPSCSDPGRTFGLLFCRRWSAHRLSTFSSNRAERSAWASLPAPVCL